VTGSNSRMAIGATPSLFIVVLALRTPSSDAREANWMGPITFYFTRTTKKIRLGMKPRRGP
jgi:hypothetical protein